MSMPFHDRIRSGDIDMAFSTQGRGHDLLLIMGFAGTMDYWGFSFLRRLSKNFRVTLFDNRGIGDTSIGWRPPSIEQFASDTAELIEALGLKAPHVMGWSMGSFIAQELALTFPEKVGKLILYGGGCSPQQVLRENETVFEELFDLMRSDEEQAKKSLSLLFPLEWLAMNPRFRSNFLSRPLTIYSANREGLRGQIRAVTSWRGSCDRLAAILHRTLVIAGEKDVIMPSIHSRRLVNGIPHARLVSFRQGGHGLIYQYPEELAEIITTFLIEQVSSSP